MKAILKDFTVLQGKNRKDIRSRMCAMLKVDGKQALTATCDDGSLIHVELMDGNDYIIEPKDNPDFKR